jgi:glucosamine kinase
MKLIADSGSTKTTWILLDGKKVKKTITTSGLNPYFHNSESVEAVIRADLAPYLVEYHIREIHFYGAGCSTAYNNRMISDAIRIFFRNSHVCIYHDILGAARALFGNGEGIACILGTGCNACYYDGSATFSKVDSLGYLFGDEGAGSYLGKTFLAAYLRKQLPPDLRDEFDEKYHFTLEDILNSLYNLPSPNRFLASFSEFIAPRQAHPFLYQLIRNSFLAFFDAQIRQYENYRSLPVSFIGSIAFYYREILKQAASAEGIRTGRILQNPAEGLVTYHSLQD